MTNPLLLPAAAGWSTACPDWRERLMTGRSLVPTLPLFQDEADRGTRIFGRMRVPDAIGQPQMRTAMGPWVFDIVAALFGSYDVARHQRMIRELFLLLPKKNGKSTIAAGLIITAGIITFRPNSRYVFIAPTKKVAENAYGQATRIIKADPVLDASFDIRSAMRLTNLTNDSVVEVKAADTDTVTGGIHVGGVIDETHEFARNSRAEGIFAEIRGALGAIPDGFLIQITTQSKAPPTGVFKQELEMARAVRDGDVSSALLPVLYELPTDISRNGGWKRREYWHLVNPNRGTFNEGFLVDLLVKAELSGGLELLASQHFNVQIGTVIKSEGWAGSLWWEKRADTSVTLARLKAECEVLVVGFDGGGADDFASMTVAGRLKSDPSIWLAWSKSWVYRRLAWEVNGEPALRPQLAQELEDLARAGDLEIVDELGDIGPLVVNQIEEIDRTGLLALVGMDPSSGGVGMLADALTLIGVSNDKERDSSGYARLVPVSQGWKLQSAIKSTEVKLSAKQLWHGDQPSLNWAVNNAKTEVKGNALYVTKEASGRAKIDPLMSLFDAVALLLENPTAPVVRSVYEDRGLLVL